MTPFNNAQANANPSATASENHLAMNDPAPSTTSSFFPNSDTTPNAAARYSREDLLDLAEHSRLPEGFDLSVLLMHGFQPGGYANGNSSRGWGKSHDTNGNNDPTICWDADGNSAPLGLQGLTAEEQEVSSTDFEPCARIPHTRCPVPVADHSLLVTHSSTQPMSTPL